MLKKLICLIATSTIICGSLVGCGQKATSTSDTKTQKQIVMKIGHAMPVNTPRHQSLLKFKELVEAKTNKGIKVDIFPSAQLGDETSMIDATKLGTIQGERGGGFEKLAPELLIYTLPFLFDKLDNIEKVTMGPIGDKIAEATKKNGLVTLTTGDGGGFRSITNNKRPILTPEDIKGLKIRTPAIDTIVKSMEAFGANPVSIPYGDTYMALKTGVADGEENPLINIESMKFNEVQKYISIIEYQWHPEVFVVNQKWYEGLTPEYQKILKECAIESMKLNDKMILEANQKALETIKKTCEVTVLTDEQKKLFSDKGKAVYKIYIDKGICTQKDIDEIQNAIK
ncbi:TRAP transporter substrate-binding protein [Clostridium sp.]|uniref:TRAP transporter substrate-binding protein n=1 Tax=Clostridium sp. TaxID=1506 RepID=UPI003D6D8B3C